MFNVPKSEPIKIPLPEAIQREINTKMRNYSYYLFELNKNNPVSNAKFKEHLIDYRQLLEDLEYNKILVNERYNNDKAPINRRYSKK